MAAKEQAQEVATTPIFSEEALRSLGSLADASALFAESGKDIRNVADELGDGFTLVDEADDKGQFVKQEMVIIDWEFRPGDYGTEYVSMRLITGAGGKYRVNDGSTGIAATLREYTDRTGRTFGFYLARGFRVSNYYIHRETKQPVADNYDGPKDPAKTFYLDTSK